MCCYGPSMRLARIVALRALPGILLTVVAVPAARADTPAGDHVPGQVADDPPYPDYWSSKPAPTTPPAPAPPVEPPNAPPETYVPGPPKPRPPKDLSSTLIGIGSHYFVTPAAKSNQGPAIDVVFGVMYGNTRNMLAFSALDGPHPAAEIALRYDLATKPKPFSFGAGLELGMIMQPVTSETHHIESTLLTGDLLVNVFNASYRWKQLFVELRVISLGVYLEQPTPITARFAIESGLQILWLPDAK